MTAGAEPQRIPWEAYFMRVAAVVASRATCVRRSVGAVAVKGRRILATGYNGAPSGVEHCTDTSCLRTVLNVPSGERHEPCRAAHVEQNVIAQAARHGISLEGADLYCTTSPCSICAKLIIQAGFRAVFFSGDYPCNAAAMFLREAGVEMHKVKGENL